MLVAGLVDVQHENFLCEASIVCRRQRLIVTLEISMQLQLRKAFNH